MGWRTPLIINRYATHPNGYHAAVRLSEDYALRARAQLDMDDPSIDCLQALLLLSEAFTAVGKGKKAYMMLGGQQSLIWCEISINHHQLAGLEWLLP
jgi:hypothetical protein